MGNGTGIEAGCRHHWNQQPYLKDFTISLERTKTLSKMVPKDKLLIAESGIVRDDDVAYLADCGVSGFLIGRAFMEHENPKALAAHWKQVYKEAAK